MLSIAIVLLMLIPMAGSVTTAEACDYKQYKPKFFYVGRDWTTKGNWVEAGYGDCGYILPYAEEKNKEIAIGETTGIGESAHEFWWREPWSKPGKKYYPYEDYLGGKNILKYEVIGPEGPPRALVDANSDYYRPSWYCNGSSITVTINKAGNYKVSIYLLDWDAPSGGAHRKVEVNVTSSGVWDIATLGTTFPENFAGGIYVIFNVNSDGIITIQVTNLDYPAHPERYAVIAGIFLDSISGTVTGVEFVGLDHETKGNWRPKYGNEYYLLPGFNVPSSEVSYEPINKTFDETNLNPEDYEVSDGACQYAADDARTYGEYPYIGTYAAYAWTLPLNRTASDPRVLIYPVEKEYHGYPPEPLNGRIYGQWDSGEMNGILNYFIIRLEIPAYEDECECGCCCDDGCGCDCGCCCCECESNGYILSIYVMDFGLMGRSETIEIWDETMTTKLDSQYINASEINEGVYLQWFIQGPTTINIKVIADPGKLNSFIDGIFLNCVKYYCGKTIGFWKNNIRKAIYRWWKRGIQVSREGILEALAYITDNYGYKSEWGFEWLTFNGTDDENLKEAYRILSSRSWWRFGRGWNWRASSMKDKAKAQILALLLTATHYDEYSAIAWIDWYEGGTGKIISDWITTILNEYNNGNYEIAKDLADYLNNLGD